VTESKHAKPQPKEELPIITFDHDVNLSGFLLDCSLPLIVPFISWKLRLI
jgi:hypothetical protein